MSPGKIHNQVVEWLKTSKRRSAEVVEALRGSVYKQFGAQAIDGDKAEAAYRRLLEHLPNRDLLLIATTNYDQSVEAGLQRLSLQPFTGMTSESVLKSPRLDVQGMWQWSNRTANQVPVLYLHGAVGWYRREDGAITQYPSDQAYNPTLGTPVFLPPDPDKDPLNDPTVAAIWGEFVKALNGATHVLVIGHSLNDQPLVAAIREWAGQARVGVGSREPDQEALESRLPGAVALKIEFGPEFDSPDLRRWVEGGA